MTHSEIPYSISLSITKLMPMAGTTYM